MANTQMHSGGSTVPAENLSDEAKASILSYLDEAGFTSMGVVVDVNGLSEKLREPNACFQDGSDYVVMEILTERAPEPEIDYSAVASEAGLAAINCTAAVVAGLVTFGSFAATPLTGGASAAVGVVTKAATVATGIACAAQVVRTYNAVASPETNTAWDNSPAYQTTMTVVDGVSLLGVGAAAAATARTLAILRRAGVKVVPAAKGMVSRAARARLARESVRSSKPGISNGKLKELVNANKVPGRFAKADISMHMVNYLGDNFAAFLSFLSSVLDGNIKGIAISLVKLES